MESDSKKRAASEESNDNSVRKKSKIENRDSGKAEKPPFNPLPTSEEPQRRNRRVFVFGNGDCGQFGLGTEITNDILRPRLHKWFDDAIKEGKIPGLRQVCAGGMHSLALGTDGKVWSWGVNDNGSLGRITDGVVDPENPEEKLDSEELEFNPFVIEDLQNDSFRPISICSGDSVSVALNAEGELRIWGSFRASDGLLGFDGKPNSPKIQFTPMTLPILVKQKLKFVQVACGTDHVLALTTQGHVWVWGNGQNGQLGRKIIERRKINGLAPERLALRRIRLIGTGSYHSFAVDYKGTVFAWGQNTFRQTGVEIEHEEELEEVSKIIWEPKEVKKLSPKALGLGRKVVEISGGEFHTLFRISDGSVYAVGRCDGGQLGFSRDHPSMILKREKEDELNRKRAEEAEKERIKEEKKELRRRRQSDQSQDPDTKTPFEGLASLEPNGLSPIRIDYISTLAKIQDFPDDSIVSISAAERHNLALSASGEVFSWGFGATSQLGLGKDTNGDAIEEVEVPTLIRSEQLKGWKVDCITAGGQHCMLLAHEVQ